MSLLDPSAAREFRDPTDPDSRAGYLRICELAPSPTDPQQGTMRRGAAARVHADVDPEPPVRCADDGACVVRAPVGTRVLVVDDNADLRETLRTMLELSGFEVATAAGGETAIEMARSYRPDVVVMDLCMPGLDGFAAAKQLRAEPEGATLPLISLSALPVPDAAAWSRRAGFDFHLSKPTDPDELVATLVQAANARRKSGAG